MNPAELQTAIFTALNHSSVTTGLSAAYGVTAIFNEWVPQVTDAGDPVGFPFITMTFPSSLEYDDKLASGQNSLVQIDIWSRDNGTQVKAIAAAARARLHRQTLGVTGFITAQVEEMVFERDPDGITRRGRLRVRVLALP